MNKKAKVFLKDERGEFGIKQIAVTVAVIVIIGFVITAVQGFMPGWIEDIWDMFIEQIEGLMS